MMITGKNKVIGGLLGVTLLVIGLFWQTSAQSNLGDNWAMPINLSQSGTAIKPVMVVDGNGILHLFWLDRFVGFVYTQNQDGVWQDPSPVLVPFSDPPYSLVADTNTLGDGYSPTILADRSNLYGFWIDSEGELAFSRTPIPNSIGSGEWAPTLSIADSITAFDVTIDDLGRLYLVYVKRTGSNGFPTGVYYRFSDDAGITWAEPELLFQSDYLRSVEEQSHVQIAVSPNNQAYIVWDNPLVEMVYLARSENRGRSWSSAELIDKRLPDDALESPGPGNILVITQDDEVHLVWQAGHTPRTCSIYHMVSTDGGESWSDPTTVLDTNSPECPNSFRLFWGNNELLFMMTEVFLTTVDRTQLFLQAWDGEIWSEPELQDAIFEFEDPDTYRAVAFSCIQDFVSASNQLILVACGSTRVIDDIWFMERPLGSREDWSLRFAPPPAWNVPDEIEKNAAVQNSLAIFAVDDEQYHAFWTAEDSDTLEQTIHYSSFSGNEWSRPLSIIESPEGSIQQAAFAIDKQRQRFLATWVDEESRKLYFSQVQISNAAIAINWQTPTQIHAIQESSEWPEIIVTEDGVIYLVFSIPVNEQRGIYLARSTDGGNSWSDPMKILDGTAIGWELVGRSRLAVDQNGNIQVAVIRHKSLLSMDDTELYHLQSLDNGLSWASLNEPFDSEVVWHDIVAVAPDVAHMIWVSFSDNRTIIWHSYSENKGLDWSQPLPVASFSGESGIPALTADHAGQLHLFYLDDLNLSHWMWDGLRWIDNEGLSIDKIIPGGALSQAATTSNSKLHVLFNGILAEADVEAESSSNPAVATLAASQVNADERYGLVHTSQDLNLPEVVPTVVLTSPATLTPVGISEVTAVPPTPTLSPTPPLIDVNAVPAAVLPINNPIGALIFSIVVVGLIIIVTFVIGYYRMRRNRT